jgi:hypothetical protein
MRRGGEVVRITVVVADVSHLVHAGGEVDRYTRTFEAPPELAAYVRHVQRNNSFATVSLAIEDDRPLPTQQETPK